MLANLLDMAEAELEFEDLEELIEAFVFNVDYGKDHTKPSRDDLLRFLSAIEGRHLATMATLPARTGLQTEVARLEAVKKAYKMFSESFKGVDYVTVDQGNGEYAQTGVCGLAARLQFTHFNPFSVMPPLEYADFQIDRYNRETIDTEWFSTFKDPVLRCWAALVMNRPMPKDHLLKGGIDKLLAATDSAGLIATMVELKGLVENGVEIETAELMPIVKAKREAVGQEVWTKDVAMSFGDLLKAIRSANESNV